MNETHITAGSTKRQGMKDLNTTKKNIKAARALRLLVNDKPFGLRLLSNQAFEPSCLLGDPGLALVAAIANSIAPTSVSFTTPTSSARYFPPPVALVLLLLRLLGVFVDR